MPRHYIKDDEGKDVKDSENHRLFWSDRDGDPDPQHSQTVYEDQSNDRWLGGSEKIDARFDPSKNEFKE